jgi:hypothetical protein
MGCVLVVSKMSAPELPGMPQSSPKTPRNGSVAWVKMEWARFRDLAAEHRGLTSAAMTAMALGVCRQRVYQLIEAGHLRTFEVMGKQFVSCADIEAFQQLDRHPGFRYEVAA